MLELQVKKDVQRHKWLSFCCCACGDSFAIATGSLLFFAKLTGSDHPLATTPALLGVVARGWSLPVSFTKK